MIRRILIKLIIAISLIGLSPLCSFAQTQSNTQAAVKFDEFGDINLSDLKARLDNFAIQLQQEPGTRGFVITYRSHRDLPGLSSRLLAPIRGYMTNTRGVPPDRLVTIDGGEADCLGYELWIVPVGKTPKPRTDAYRQYLVDIDSTLKFDEYYYYVPQAYSGDEYEEYEGSSLEAFADTLRANPHSQAYIIAYPQSYGGRVDAPNTAKKMLVAERGALINKFHIAAPRIKGVNGGYRKRRQIELWVVPRGEHPPIATPNAYPKRRR